MLDHIPSARYWKLWKGGFGFPSLGLVELTLMKFARSTNYRCCGTTVHHIIQYLWKSIIKFVKWEMELKLISKWSGVMSSATLPFTTVRFSKEGMICRNICILFSWLTMKPKIFGEKYVNKLAVDNLTRCNTRPNWGKNSQLTRSSFILIMACGLISARPLSEPMSACS